MEAARFRGMGVLCERMVAGPLLMPRLASDGGLVHWFQPSTSPAVSAASMACAGRALLRGPRTQSRAAVTHTHVVAVHREGR